MQRQRADFGSTIFWAGIESIMIGGVEFTDYDHLVSSTGVDYRYPSAAVVPAPAAAWLFLSGLAGLPGFWRAGQSVKN